MSYPPTVVPSKCFATGCTRTAEGNGLELFCTVHHAEQRASAKFKVWETQQAVQTQMRKALRRERLEMIVGLLSALVLMVFLMGGL